MRKLICILLILFVFAGCSTNVEDGSSEVSGSEISQDNVELSELSILCPTGAPSFAFAHEVQENDKLEFVDGTDLLQAAFVNKEYDVIIAPSNLGAMLAKKGASDYKIAAILTWGNLYVIGTNEEALDEGRIATFGEAAVPQKIWDTVKGSLDIDFAEEYYNSASDVQTALIGGSYQVGLIAEPAATATITKAKQSDLELSVLLDLQELWQNTTGFEGGYPQAAIFVLEENYKADQESYDALFERIASYSQSVTNSDKSDLIADIDLTGADAFGIASSAIVAKTWDKMNIRFAYAKDHEENLKSFLNLFGIEEVEDLILR